MATNKPIAIEMNAETGEVIERDWTDEEIAEAAIFDAAFQAQKEANAAARTSALAKLSDLGLTAEEIAAL
jgi:hypothetical protein